MIAPVQIQQLNHTISFMFLYMFVFVISPCYDICLFYVMLQFLAPTGAQGVKMYVRLSV